MCMVRSPKIDQWSSRTDLRERTLRLSVGEDDLTLGRVQ